MATRNTATAAQVWNLEADDTLRLPNRRAPTLLRVERGTVLVTRRGDLEDHVLEPGDELVLTGRDRAVAWALQGAAVVSSRNAASPEKAVAGDVLRGFTARMSAALRSRATRHG